MSRLHFARLPLAFAALVMISACSDSSTPSARVFASAPVQAYTGGPDMSDYHNLTGQLWVCPDVPYLVIGFAYRYSIVDDATSQVVASGVSKNLTAGQCVMLASVPTTGPRTFYTATVTEDPAGKFKVSNITADYGANFPNAPPGATISGPNGRTISSAMSNDFGVLYVFWH